MSAPCRAFFFLPIYRLFASVDEMSQRSFSNVMHSEQFFCTSLEREATRGHERPREATEKYEMLGDLTVKGNNQYDFNLDQLE